jgi:hypothetical protein
MQNFKLKFARFIILVLMIFAASPSFAAVSLFKAKHVYLGLGLFNHNTGRYATEKTGKTGSSLSSTYTTINLTGKIPLWINWNFSPTIGYTPFYKKLANDNETSRLIPIAFRIERKLSIFEAHAGPGILIYSVGGKGGTTVLSNGTSTATFGLPTETRSSKLWLLDLGAGIDAFSTKLAFDVMITGLSSSRRAINLGLSLSYGIF